jgi:hypothetical protein
VATILEDFMKRGLPRPTPSAVAVVLQVASLLVVASGLVAILISDINRHKTATSEVEPPAFVSMMHR